MKYIYKIILFAFVLVFSKQIVYSQPISFNTQTLGSGYTPNNGQNGISFVIQNTTAFPVVLTSVANSFGTFASGLADFTLWYSTSSLSGAPGTVASPTWTIINSVTGVSCAAGGQTTVFPLLAFTIPNGATYRFYLQSSITLDYVNSGAGVTPNTFSNSGVNLLVGDALILGQAVGFGGGPTTAVFTPRSFCGSIGLNILSSPCVGAPTAGTASALPNNPCPGIPVTLSLAGSTAASGLAYQWQRASSPTGPWSTAGLTVATTNPSFYNPPPGSTTFYRCIVTCVFSGLTSTSNVTNAVVVQNWSATGPCWCIPTYASGGAQDNITEVSLGTLINNTAAAGNPTPFYVNYAPFQIGTTPTLSIPNLYAGLPASMSVTYGSDPLQFGAMWIDYNHSGAFEPSEYFSPNTNAGPSGTHIFNFTPLVTSTPGITRMRIRGGDDVQMGSNQACGPTNSPFGETEDYLVNIIPAGPFDPSLGSLTAPVGNLCTDSLQILTAQICNYGSTNINLVSDPVYINFIVNGPSGPITYIDTLNTGTLNAYGISCATASVAPVNMYAGGNYSINAYVSCPTLTNAALFNDSLTSPILITNYRPTAGPDYPLCQFDNIPFGQGLTVSGCSAPISDSVTINFTITGPCVDNVGSTGIGTSTGLPANCSDQFACNFGNGIVPTLPPGSSFVTNSVLTVTNLSTNVTSWASEARFNLFGINPVGSNLLSAGTQGNAIATGSTNFTYSRPVLPAQVSSIFSALPAGGTLNLGYWESWNDDFTISDIGINAGGGTTVATLKIYYQFVPPAFAWYDVPTLGTSLYSLSPFNPLLYTNAVVNNSNVPGLYTFYAACLGLPSCRVPVNLKINPTPQAFQDSLFICEFAASANNGIFDLTTIDTSVSGNNLAASVDYYGDQSLINLIANPTNDTSSTNFIYSKVYYASTGCYSSDTVYLDVSPIPQFMQPVYSGFACAPNAIDISSLITIISPSPVDSIFYDDQSYTGLHPNPHAIYSVDTVYMVVKTSTGVVCSDTSTAYIDIIPASNNIASQNTSGNYSMPGPIPCGTITLTNGNTETLYTTNDCRKVAKVTDSPLDLIDLGNVTICEDVFNGVPTHVSTGSNPQPYVNRSYEITPTTNGKATVCLYYLDQDFADYDAYASLSTPTWPSITPGSNLVITQVDNGDLNTPGHTAITIPNSSITSSYDPSTTVWTVCFPVDSFSFFYAHTANPFNIPLPVSLLSFTGKAVDGSSHLNWTTSSEQNNSHFILERSSDAKNFRAISSKINSKALNGNSQVKLDYSYEDKTPLNGHNHYRLQQVDIDGHVSYSGTVDVYFGDETMVTLYPNPVNTELNIDINTPKATMAYVKIMDATGRVVRMVETSLQAGNNTTKIDLQSLTDGMYMVQITNNKGLNYTQAIRKK